MISPSDPCSAWTTKANRRVQFGYGLDYLVDIENAIIVDVDPRVDQLRPTHAREARADTMSELGQQTDPLEPPGRCCGCWPTSPISFSRIAVRGERWSGRRGAGGDGQNQPRGRLRLHRARQTTALSPSDDGVLALHGVIHYSFVALALGFILIKSVPHGPSYFPAQN